MASHVLMPPQKKQQQRKAQTQFLFVHHDSETISDRVDAQRVNAHVQVLYRRRKRGVNERWKPSDANEAKQIKLKMKDGIFAAWHRRRNMRIAAQHPALSVVEGALPQLINQASSPVRKGNSDPFTAMPIPIGPTLNMVLIWLRTQGIPALFPVESAVLKGPTPSAERTWKQAVFSVQNPNLVYPYLASVSALMARRTEYSHMHKMVLQLKDQAYVVLRRTLTASEVIADLVTRSMIVAMFWAELATGRPSAARTHLKMLDLLVRRSAGSIDVPCDCRLAFLVADTNLAVSELSMPIADPRDVSVEEHFEKWKTALSEGMRESVLCRVSGLHASIEDRELRFVFTRLRELIAITEFVADGSIREPSVFRWMDARLLSCESQFVALSLRHDATISEASLSRSRNADVLTRCISSAALAWISSTWASSNRGMGQIPAKRLKQAMEEAQALDRCADMSEELFLWLLYAGASVESRDRKGIARTKAWFSVQLKIKVEQEGLSKVVDVLKKFLYMDRFSVFDVAP